MVEASNINLKNKNPHIRGYRMWSAVRERSIMRAIASGPSRILGPE